MTPLEKAERFAVVALVTVAASLAWMTTCRSLGMPPWAAVLVSTVATSCALGVALRATRRGS